MFKSKTELDRHVGKMLARAKTTTDRNKESLKIARYYFDLKEYHEANLYLTNYLSEFSLEPLAWKLKAEICEISEKNFAKAVDYYCKAFNLGDEADKNLLLKICNCYTMIDEKKIDQKKATEWLSKAEKSFKYEKVVFDLKEKLINLVGKSKSTSNGSSISANSKELESFLIESLNENLLNEELHLKLLKTYLKNGNVSKAISHIAKLEYGQYFISRESNRTWYKSAIELVETNLNESTKDQQLPLKFILLTLINHYLKFELQNAQDYASVMEIFIKFDEIMRTIDIEDVKDDQMRSIKNEQLSQFYFLTGLMLLKLNKDNTKRDELRASLMSNERETTNSFSSNLSSFACVVCFFKSSTISKPNEFNTVNNNKSSLNDLQKSINHMVKLAYRDSALRYSIIGNWFKFVSDRHYAADQFEFFEDIKKFTINYKIKSLIVEMLGLCHKIGSKSFLNNVDQNGEFFKFDVEKFYVIDFLTLESADKFILENQTHNLNFLIWHSLLNTKFFTTSLGDLSEIPPYFYLRSSKVHSKQNLLNYGVENLNICNLESLNLIDMKVFFYSVYYQCLSYIKTFNTTSTSLNTDMLLFPYWLQPTSSFANDKQLELWFYLVNSLHSLSSSKKQQTTNWLDADIDEPLCVKMDSNVREDVKKVLEMMRLKATSIKLDSTKYKLNINICIGLVKYLQDVYDCLSVGGQKTATDEAKLSPNKKNICQSIENREEKAYSPAAKQKYMSYYLIRYWNFVTKQIIKLKQMEKIDSPSVGSEHSSTARQQDTDASFTALNDSFANSLVLGSASSSKSLFVDFFNYHELNNSKRVSQLFKSNRDYLLTKTVDTSKRYSFGGVLNSTSNNTYFSECCLNDLNAFDSVLQIGLLNLIYLHIQCDSNLTMSSYEQNDTANLDEAIGLFNVMNECIFDRFKTEQDNNELQLCKKIAEYLVERRDELERLKVKITGEEDLTHGAGTKLEKVESLIDLINRKICSNFEQNKTLLEEETDVQVQEETKAGEEHLPSLPIINESVRQAQLVEEQKEKEKEKQQQLEEQEELRKEAERLKELENENIKNELLKEKERLKLEEERIRVERQQIEMEKQKLKELEKARKLELELETAREIKLQQEKLSSTARLSSLEQNKKILDLIEIINKQRLSHFNLNLDTLNEQFSFLKNQKKILDNEIGHLIKCIRKRVNQTNELNQFVKTMNYQANLQQSLNDPFYMMYWLSQQNPIMNQHLQNPIKMQQVPVKVPSQPAQVVNQNPAQFVRTPPAFTDRSMNQYLTPSAQDKSLNVQQKLSGNHLEKPIGDLKFPLNQNLFNQMISSVDNYNKNNVSGISKTSDTYYDQEDDDDDDDEEEEEDDDGEDDEEYEDGQEGEHYDDEDYDENEHYDDDDENDDYETQNANYSNMTKQETFLSCNDDWNNN